jgi:hypothetical protein
MNATHIRHLAIAIALTAGSAYAVEPTEQEPGSAAPSSTGAQSASPSVSEAELAKFAEIQDDVQAVSQKYQAKLEQTPADNVEKLKAEMTNELVEVVEDGGLNVDQYNLIAQAVVTDPQLQQRVRSLMK